MGVQKEEEKNLLCARGKRTGGRGAWGGPKGLLSPPQVVANWLAGGRLTFLVLHNYTLNIFNLHKCMNINLNSVYFHYNRNDCTLIYPLYP